ncbi:hypothetical protein GJ744_009501 [Endocarpon pusillum]|uniref:Uncharacterized protein n=1 Tax=Endocarpon pusillum TaxID=364733 RepID=A0A8H7AIV0_9EURO|nr:hypothetical protein GJ744_009501 [Endocarpon pusillum]
MEPHSWSLEMTANDIGKKRNVCLDEDHTERCCKRVCAEPFSNPIPPWEAKTGNMHAYSQFTETASNLTNNLDFHSPAPFRTEPYFYDTAYLLPNGGEVPGTSHSAADFELTSLANMTFMYPDTTGIAAQTLGPGPNTAALIDMSQHNDDEDPLTPLNRQGYQIQQLNDLESSWGTEFYDLNTSFWVKSTASFGNQLDLSPIQYLPPIQSQAVGMTCFPTNAENSTLVAGIETGLSTERPYMNNEVNFLESELTMNVEIQSKLQSPVTSESSMLASNSVPDVCDEVPDPDSVMELSAAPKYDACFGVVLATATSPFKSSSGTQQVPVSIAACADMLKLSFQDSKKYAGLITCPALSMLSKDWCIQLSATLMAPNDKLDQVSKKAEVHNSCVSRKLPVRIMVYGLTSERVAVGNLLSGAGLYLQHPSASEYDGHVKYINPHYLLRPGSHMPNLEQLSVSSDSGSPKSSESLDEVNKCRFLRVFDLANEVGSSLTAEPSCRLRSTLKEHQLTALAMMIEKEEGILKLSKFPSLWELSSCPDATMKYRHRITGTHEISPRPVYGGILADEMGLGKTLSVLALICWSLDSLASELIASNDEESRGTLIVAPKSTINGWQEEIKKHIHLGQLRAVTYHGCERKGLSKKLKNFDVVLTTYETMRSEWTAKGALYLERWHRIVLDEAHHIRTRSSQAFQAACAIDAQHHWCLTGTPIHNSLDDYGALLSFVGVQPFADKAAFDFWITKPIKQNRPHGLRRLEDLVRATCLRRKKLLSKGLLELPQRSEKVEWIMLSPEDRELYEFFKMKTAKIASQLSRRHPGAPKVDHRKDTNILTLIGFLRRICDHGEHLLPTSALEAWKSRDNGSVDWQMMGVGRARCDKCGGFLDEIEAPASIDFELQCQHSICPGCAIRSQERGADDGPACPKCIKQIVSEGDSTVSQVPGTFIRPSAKVNVLMRNLRQEQFSETEGDQNLPRKSLVFSFWTKMLDIVQLHLELNGFIFRRIDGQSSLQERRKAICQFNDDPKCTVMLASICSAGEGVDLTAANHVHLLEPQWNPMTEAQAVDRVHRIGQTREVLTTRYITRDSIETYVQWIQQDKIRLINQSLDSANISQVEIDEQRWKKLQLNVDCMQNVEI